MAGEWLTTDQLQSQDRSKQTKTSHRGALDYFQLFGRTPTPRGRGLEGNYKPNITNGCALVMGSNDALTDEILSDFLTFCFNHFRNRDGIEVQPNMRKIHGWLSYSCLVNLKGDNLRESPFHQTNLTWKGIWQQDIIKNYIGEKSPSLTIEDLDKLDGMQILNEKG
eukprot:52476_1